MKLEDLSPGDVACYWHEEYSGDRPQSTLVYCKVIRKAKVKVLVRDEWGSEGWVYPGRLNHKITPEKVADLELAFR